MAWTQIIKVILTLVCAMSIGSWVAAPHAAIAASLEHPSAKAGSREQDTQKAVEDRLNADFSRMSERYQRELQRGGGPDDSLNPVSPRTDRERQALEDIADRDGRTPKTQNPPQRRRNRWLQRFQFHLDPFE